MPENCYFESHLAIKLFNENEEIKLRDYNSTQEQFKENVFSEKDKILKLGFEIDKVIIEFAIYDTNVSHDKEWLINT